MNIPKLLLLIAAMMFIVSRCHAGFFDFSSSNSAVEINCVKNSSLKTNEICIVFFSETIETPDSYRDLYKMLALRKSGDLVYLQLAGNGGSGAGLVYILNAIKNTDAKVISIVDSSVASAHAILAIATDQLIVRGDAYFLFHTISISNMHLIDCSEETGIDRGLSKYQKCRENMLSINDFYNKAINKYVYKILNERERKLYDQGHDVILFTEDLKYRMLAK